MKPFYAVASVNPYAALDEDVSSLTMESEPQVKDGSSPKKTHDPKREDICGDKERITSQGEVVDEPYRVTSEMQEKGGRYSNAEQEHGNYHTSWITVTMKRQGNNKLGQRPCKIEKQMKKQQSKKHKIYTILSKLIHL